MGDRSPMAVTGKEDDDEIDQRRISVKWSPGLAERCHGHCVWGRCHWEPWTLCVVNGKEHFA